MADSIEARDELLAFARKLRTAERDLASPLLELASTMEQFEQCITRITVDLRLVDYFPFSNLAGTPVMGATEVPSPRQAPPFPGSPQPFPRTEKPPRQSPGTPSPPDAAAIKSFTRADSPTTDEEPGRYAGATPVSAATDPPVFSFRRSSGSVTRDVTPGEPASDSYPAHQSSAPTRRSVLKAALESSLPTSEDDPRRLRRVKEALLAAGHRRTGRTVLPVKPQPSVPVPDKPTVPPRSRDAIGEEADTATALMAQFADELLRTARTQQGSSNPDRTPRETAQRIDSGGHPTSALGKASPGTSALGELPHSPKAFTTTRGEQAGGAPLERSPQPYSWGSPSSIETAIPENVMLFMESLTQAVLATDDAKHPTEGQPVANTTPKMHPVSSQPSTGMQDRPPEQSPHGGSFHAAAGRDRDDKSGEKASPAPPSVPHSGQGDFPNGSQEGAPSSLDQGEPPAPQTVGLTGRAPEAIFATAPRTDTDSETLATLVNEALIAQARRHGVDLS